jgi:hypothetical protein
MSDEQRTAPTMTDQSPVDPPTSGRRESANPPGRDTASLAPAAPASTVPRYGFSGYGVLLYVHELVSPQGQAFVAECGVVALALPGRVRPTSRWLMPCANCFPDGLPPDATG